MCLQPRCRPLPQPFRTRALPTGWSCSPSCRRFTDARARARSTPGELVYYGPAPSYYGIGEVVAETDEHVLVDFRGTGQFGVHEEALARRYVLPIPEDRAALL